MSGLKRGTLFLVSGWAVQLLAGYFLNSWLGRTLAPEVYGTYGVVMAVLLYIEVGAISGIPTAVQKFVSAHQDQAEAIVRVANWAQFVFVSVLFGAAMLLAPWVSSLMGDRALIWPLRIALWDIWVYSYFFIYMSVQNGLKRFGVQALLIVVYSLSKLGGVLLLVRLWNNVEGALVANILGSVVGLAMALLFWRWRPRVKRAPVYFDWRALLRFAWPVALFSLTIHLFPSVDLWMVKAFCGANDPGYYTAAQAIAKIPYMLFFGLSATVLPSISEALSRHDEATARETVATSIRLLLIVVVPLCVLVWPWAEEAVALLFGSAFAPGGQALRLLMISHSLLAFLFLLTTILNADNRPRLSLWITLAAVVIDVILVRILTPVYGMTGAAAATVLALLLGVVIGGVVVWRRFKPTISPRFPLRVVSAAALIGLAAHRLSVSGIVLIAAGLGLFFLYLLLLWAMGEYRLADLHR